MLLMSKLTDQDLYLFNEGSHVRLYRHLGAQLANDNGRPGAQFAVWAPDAQDVYLMGSFNDWSKTALPMTPRGQSGIWEAFVPNVQIGDSYKYHIVSRYNGYKVDKADPFAFHTETPPRTASKDANLDYEWHDR